MPFSNHETAPPITRVATRFCLKAIDDSMTEIIVIGIVYLVKTGEHRDDQLAELVLSDLADATQADSALINPSQRGRALLIPDFVHRNIFTIFVQYNPL